MVSQHPHSGFADHPCFNVEARHTHGRIHLPVAARCNVQCKFCDRKYSCVNESRPGVTAALMTPEEALRHFERQRKLAPHIAVVGIAGPGDPFAQPQETLHTFRLVRDKNPDILLCVASNGLNVWPYVDELAALTLSHVAITVNAVDPTVGARIYAWIQVGDQCRGGPEAAALLWENQRRPAGTCRRWNTASVAGPTPSGCSASPVQRKHKPRNWSTP